jgi:aminoglycoside phosphotransferase (APT) family kinase protein
LDKSLERIELFYKTFERSDHNEVINDKETELLSALLERVDWNFISHGTPGRVHGDFHFENILFDKDASNFIFLDWRQDFGGSLEVGDVYYDLAKLLHGLIVSHEIVTTNHFRITWTENEIIYDFHRKNNLVECEEYFYIWLERNGFDVKKVKIITALIFLNIAPLHHNPYSLLLFALGKSMLIKETRS